MTQPPTVYIGRIADARVAAEHGSRRVRLSVCGKETEMSAREAQAFKDRLTEAIRRSG